MQIKVKISEIDLLDHPYNTLNFLDKGSGSEYEKLMLNACIGDRVKKVLIEQVRDLLQTSLG